MPWGVHKGKPLEKVPAAYLLWLLEQPWLKDAWPGLHAYILKHQDQLIEERGELREEGDHDEREFTSFEDYLRDYRGF